MSGESKLNGTENMNDLANEVEAIESSMANASDPSPEPSTSSKKKKKAKVSQIKSALGAGSSKQAEEVYNAVKKQVEKSAGAEEANKLSPEAVAEILRLTSMKEYLQGKTGLMGKNKKCVCLYLLVCDFLSQT
jgi:predicted ribosome quality control (RQC) complex YloA/Tae2 family protein